jgi:signal transduction histidine kinase
MPSRRVRWLAIALPALVVGVIELLSDTILDPYIPFPWDTIIVTAVVAILAAIFSAVTFGRMDNLTASLRARNAEVEARAATATALHSVSLAIASLADLEAILGTIVDSARRLLGGDIGLLVLIGPDGEPSLRSASGPAAAFDRTGGQGGDEIERFLRSERPPAILAAPLRRGGSTIGTLAVAGWSSPSHQVGDVETLSSLANQAAIAIENDRLAAALRELAVRHERERIAQEIHDGLAQVLGYVNTKSQAVAGLLEAGRLEEATLQMAELSAAARSIYVDVREAIQGLTEPIGDEVDLGTEVRDYAGRFADAAKLVVSVQVEPGLDGTPLTPATRDEVFGIVREALTNVRKHAAAHRVVVTLGTRDDRLVVRVADDGRGFDPERVKASPNDWPQYGMTTMRHRAAAIDGQISWTSVPGTGTTVELVAPLDGAVDGTVRPSPEADDVGTEPTARRVPTRVGAVAAAEPPGAEASRAEAPAAPGAAAPGDDAPAAPGADAFRAEAPAAPAAERARP